MQDTDKKADSLPEEFASEDEAEEFWSTHSITDYEELLEPVDLEVDLKRRHFEIEIDEESFLALCASAKKHHKPVKQIASEIIRERLETEQNPVS